MGELFNKISFTQLKELLDFKVEQYNQLAFIEKDPISIPHQVSGNQNIESIGLIIATIAWGNRIAIIKSGEKLLQIMGYEPYWFIMNASKKDLEELHFVHRTFNENDLKFFILSLRKIYQQYNSIESSFINDADQQNIKSYIVNFRQNFLSINGYSTTEKHVSNPQKNSACKRLNMFLRWMVRKDSKGVDFGIWDQIKMHELYMPLDVHSGRIARELGLLTRKQDDWKALEELMQNLRKFDATDPVKYDFALFGIGVNEKSKSL